MILSKSCGCDPILGITERMEHFEKPQGMGGECEHTHSKIQILWRINQGTGLRTAKAEVIKTLR